VLCQPGSSAEQIAREVLATPQAFISRFRGRGDPEQRKKRRKNEQDSAHSRLLREHCMILICEADAPPHVICIDGRDSRQSCPPETAKRRRGDVPRAVGTIAQILHFIGPSCVSGLRDRREDVNGVVTLGPAMATRVATPTTVARGRHAGHRLSGRHDEGDIDSSHPILARVSWSLN
jgi:hypothetical protein